MFLLATIVIFYYAHPRNHLSVDKKKEKKLTKAGDGACHKEGGNGRVCSAIEMNEIEHVVKYAAVHMTLAACRNGIVLSSTLKTA